MTKPFYIKIKNIATIFCGYKIHKNQNARHGQSLLAFDLFPKQNKNL